ncbi:hypothetical protein DE146DRAFT_774223 [Phaeosphaeria sp. MPI-PUGE-AT-0046c]|nr:hypothetical protein DE146DRAFT_774223 [Phaeosphaeria sp. MPI-PUGE-AT-0046c]
MDIHRWLDETVEIEAPQKPAETTTSDFFCPPGQPRRVLRAKRAQQHTKSDSSILAPQSRLHTTPPKPPGIPDEDDTNASACSEASRSSHNSPAERDLSSHCYARRPRHKTRPERYEPKRGKESKNHVHASRKGKSTKSASRSKSKKRKKTENAAGQTFHAKNVSRDRLTLKPREQLGLFNKGKTSTAVRGRGSDTPAVPDLVFSEMRFLQKDQPSSEPNIQQFVPKKKLKKDHVHTKEGEISAYFTSTRPVLAEKDGNAPSHLVPTVTDMAARHRGHKQTQSRKSSDVVPTIEALDRGPYLASDSRGPGHESTSYVSWSESVRGPDVAFSRPEQPSTSYLEQAESSKPSWMRHTTSKAQYARATQTTPHADNRTSNSSVERFRISSVVAPQPRVSRSHSCPQRSSSPRKANPNDRIVKFQGAESFASPSSPPPLALPRSTNERPSPRTGLIAASEGQEISRATAANILRQPNGAVGTDRTLTAGKQRTSSDWENIIQHCNHSILEQDWTARQLDGGFTRKDRGATDISNRETIPMVQGEARRRPTVRFLQVEVPRPNEVLTYTSPSFYEQQMREQPTASLYQEESMDMNESCLSEQDLVYAPDAQMYDEQDWDDQREVLHDEGDLSAGFDDWEGARVSDDRVQKLPSDDGVVAWRFWRPNKLY